MFSIMLHLFQQYCSGWPIS